MKIEHLKQGIILVFETALEEIVLVNFQQGRLKFTTDAELGVEHGRVQFIDLGTPPDEDGSADLHYVLAVTDTIARLMTEKRIVAVKSTVPVGTCDKVRAALAQGLAERGLSHLVFDVASNPEFLKEGSAVADSRKPDRIILGTATAETEAVLRKLYMPQNRNHEKIIVMYIRSSELTKYAANCMIAARISLMNEMTNLADILGVDIEMVRKGIGSDSRICYHFIYPGIGCGGSCFPKDEQALVRTATEANCNAQPQKAVELRNSRQKNVLMQTILRHFAGAVQGRTFALWGLAFKPNTDDMREAPSRVIMEASWEQGARIAAYDLRAMAECLRLYGERDDLVLVRNQEKALEGAGSLIIATEWKSFAAPDLDLIARRLKLPVIFDGRNFYDPWQVRRHGVAYFGIGRGSDRVNDAGTTEVAG